MIDRTKQFYLRSAESTRRDGGEVTRLYATTAGEPYLVFSSRNRGDVERVRDRILASLAWSDDRDDTDRIAAECFQQHVEEWEK